MKKGRLGFTIIEVAIFLAITGLLFLGVTIGVQNSINKQRENDALQGFMEFLRGVYSQVENVQNYSVNENGVPNGGHSELAIYGKVITFDKENDNNKISTYTVIGRAVGANDSDVSFGDLGLTIFEPQESGSDQSSPKTFIMEDDYTPKWDTKIQCGKELIEGCTDGSLFKGSVLILRHPMSGIINTFYSEEMSAEAALERKDFSTMAIDFCVNTSNSTNNGFRSDVRIVEGATNASAIELVPEEQSGC